MLQYILVLDETKRALTLFISIYTDLDFKHQPHANGREESAYEDAVVIYIIHSFLLLLKYNCSNKKLSKEYAREEDQLMLGR